MEPDHDKIDEAVLGLMWLTLHDQFRAWKGFDWDTLNRLYEKGLIVDPKNKTKSVALTDEGLRRSEELFRKLFSRNGPAAPKTLSPRRWSLSLPRVVGFRLALSEFI